MYTVPAAPGSFPTLSLRIFPWMLDPVPRRYIVCSHLFLPRCHRPSPEEKWVGFPQLSRLKRLRAGGFSRLQIFRYVPASKFARPPDRPYRWNAPAGQPGLLRPSRTRFVTSPRIGYANRPTTGNWRYGDLHPARLRPCRLLLSVRPPCHPGRSHFASPVGDHDCPCTIFPVSSRLKRSLAYTPCATGLPHISIAARRPNY